MIDLDDSQQGWCMSFLIVDTTLKSYVWDFLPLLCIFSEKKLSGLKTHKRKNNK